MALARKQPTVPKIPMFPDLLFTRAIDSDILSQRTIRQVHRRVSEHLPSWFDKSRNKAIRSSILAYRVDTEHHVDSNKAFKVIYRILYEYNSYIQQRRLVFSSEQAESVYSK
ncbi:unnamed protein product [Trichobilharzia regenti]|nr:unnamed protein product [Trichobilharzia regenti]